MSHNMPQLLRGKPAIAAIITMIAAIAAPQLGLAPSEFENEIFSALTILEPIIMTLEPLLMPILAMIGIGSYAGVKKKVTKAKAEIPEHYVHEDDVAKAKNELPDGAEWKTIQSSNAYVEPNTFTTYMSYDGKADTEPPTKHEESGIEYSEPEWANEEAWFSTNLSNSGDNEDPVRRYLPADVNCLWVMIRDAKAIGIQLYDNKYGLIQIDQSHDKDEDNDSQTTRIEMFAKSGKRFPPGIYKVRIRATVLGKGIGSDGRRDPKQDNLIEFRFL